MTHRHRSLTTDHCPWHLGDTPGSRTVPTTQNTPSEPPHPGRLFPCPEDLRVPRAARPCAHVPGDHNDPLRCPELTTHRSGLCPTHLSAQRARVDAQRPNANARGYDATHRADRPPPGTRCATPSCRRTDSLHRDHIDGNPTNNAPSNIQWLCQSHHSSKTLTHDVQRDDRGRILPKHPRRDSTPAPTRPTARVVDL